jgi:hypothetical protein
MRRILGWLVVLTAHPASASDDALQELSAVPGLNVPGPFARSAADEDDVVPTVYEGSSRTE